MQIIQMKGFQTLVDDDVYEWAKNYTWHPLKGKCTTYATRNHRLGPNEWKTMLLHREIMNTKDDEDVDHKDHNGLNNQRYNMRNVTKSQNHMNTSKWVGASIYKGVSWDKKRGKWKAYISVDRKQIHLGFYDVEIEAAKAYDAKAVELFGENALLNFPLITQTV